MVEPLAGLMAWVRVLRSGKRDSDADVVDELNLNVVTNSTAQRRSNEGAVLRPMSGKHQRSENEEMVDSYVNMCV